MCVCVCARARARVVSREVDTGESPGFRENFGRRAAFLMVNERTSLLGYRRHLGSFPCYPWKRRSRPIHPIAFSNSPRWMHREWMDLSIPTICIRVFLFLFIPDGYERIGSFLRESFNARSRVTSARLSTFDLLRRQIFEYSSKRIIVTHYSCVTVFQCYNHT